MGVSLWLTSTTVGPGSTSSDLKSLIDSLSERHSTPKFDPHVTLGRVPPSISLDVALERLERSVSEWRNSVDEADDGQASRGGDRSQSDRERRRSLRLEFQHLGTHAADRIYFQYLFVQVRLDERLRALRRAVREGMSSDSTTTSTMTTKSSTEGRPNSDSADHADAEDDKDDYFPHLSLAYGLDEPEDRERPGTWRNALEIIDRLERDGTAGRALARSSAGADRTVEGYEVKGHDAFEVDEVLIVRCEGRPEEWEVLGRVAL
ncbi:hypothetical protein JCM10212_005224 [Sporobolomyces blumeae]